MHPKFGMDSDLYLHADLGLKREFSSLGDLAVAKKNLIAGGMK